jgi:hypothetical protein
MPVLDVTLKPIKILWCKMDPGFITTAFFCARVCFEPCTNPLDSFNISLHEFPGTKSTERGLSYIVQVVFFRIVSRDVPGSIETIIQAAQYSCTNKNNMDAAQNAGSCTDHEVQ